MRGQYGTATPALEKALEGVASSRWEQMAEGDLEEITISPDTLFVQSGWMFKSPYSGQEYPKRLIDMNYEEAMEVCAIFFSKIKDLQKRKEVLEKMLKEKEEELRLFHSNASLQLLG